MTKVRMFIALAGLLLLTERQLIAAVQEGIAMAIVYDNSGSMKQPVRTSQGGSEAKYLIANRALLDVVQRIERFATNAAAGPPRSIHAGLFVFEGSGVKEAVKFGPFNPRAFRTWVQNYSGPGAGTPLGTALDSASRVVLSSPYRQKHVLVITDGMNTAGPAPERVLPDLQKASAAKGAPLFVHFVAFDIDAKHFAPLKKLGVTVVGAVDEQQLNQQLEFILEEKILLEKETR